MRSISRLRRCGRSIERLDKSRLAEKPHQFELQRCTCGSCASAATSSVTQSSAGRSWCCHTSDRAQRTPRATASRPAAQRRTAERRDCRTHSAASRFIVARVLMAQRAGRRGRDEMKRRKLPVGIGGRDLHQRFFAHDVQRRRRASLGSGQGEGLRRGVAVFRVDMAYPTLRHAW